MNEQSLSNGQDWFLLVKEIEQEMIKQGLNQTNLSEITGLKPSNISRMLSGNQRPSLKTLLKITKALNKTLKLK